VDAEQDVSEQRDRRQRTEAIERFVRRAQNLPGRRRPVASISASRCDVMRNPLMAKKTSTPT